MKILFTYEYPFHKCGYGGGQQIIRDLSKSLTNQGHEVIIACLGIDELKLNEIDNPVRYEFQYDYKVGIRSFLFASFGSIKLINKHKPDFVLSFSSESAIISLYCKLKKIPFYIYIAAPYLPIFKFRRPILYFKNIRFHLPLYLQYIGIYFSNKIFSISDFIREQAINNWNTNEKNIINIGCAISNEIINYKPLVTKINSEIRIATTGRIMFTQKPIDLVAVAISKSKLHINEWHIIGSGSDLDNFKNLLQNLNLLEVTTIHSTLTTKQICELYDNIEIVILPSYNESFFITAFEAISLKKVLITNKVANLDKIFKDFKTIIFLDDVSISSINKGFKEALDVLNSINLINDLTSASEFVNLNYNWKNISLKLIDNVEL